MKPVRNCLQCRRRKLKCDRREPCGPCKTRDEGDQCQFNRTARIDACPVRETYDHSTDKGQGRKFVETYFEEQKRQTTSYVITRELFEKGCERHGESFVWKAFVEAMYGVGMLFSADVDVKRASRHLCEAEDLFNASDVDRHPTVHHVRVLFLLVVGFGPLRGPHQSGLLHRACFLAHVLNLHLEPDVKLPHEDRLDRINLYTTLVKADWFSAMGLGRTFTAIKPNAEALPSLFDSARSVIDPRNQFSLAMAATSRRIVERELMHRSKWFDETITLLDEVDRLEASAGKEAIEAPLLVMMFSFMRWSVTKPFFHRTTLAQGRNLHSICLASAVKNLTALSSLIFPLWEHQAPPFSVVGGWYHVFLSVRCALFVRRYVIDSPLHAETRKEAQDALFTVQAALSRLARDSAIARDGLAALLENKRPASSIPLASGHDAITSAKEVDGAKRRRKLDESVAGSTLLDQLVVFDDSVEDGFSWESIAWLEPEIA